MSERYHWKGGDMIFEVIYIHAAALWFLWMAAMFFFTTPGWHRWWGGGATGIICLFCTGCCIKMWRKEKP